MAGCVLRASGSAFDVDVFLKSSPFRPTVVYRKGQRRKPASRGPHIASGFNLVICPEEDSLEKQIKSALAFLRGNREELTRLTRFGGVETVVLDFSCPQGEIAIRSARFPSELLVAAGAAGIDIHISFYLLG